MPKKSPSIKEKTPITDKVKNNAIPKFLLKTYDMLESCNYGEYVSWSSNGTAIVIKQTTEFAERVLPEFFKHSNLASFVRQLNMYKFKKKKDSQYDNVYFHALFYRGNKSQLGKITRKGLEPSDQIFAQSTSDSEPVQKESESEKPDLEHEMSSVLSENVNLKKKQETMNSRLIAMEEKIAELQKANEELSEQSKQHDKNKEDLKKIISSIAVTLGPFLVQSAMESVQKEHAKIDKDYEMELKLLLPDIDSKSGEYYSQGSTDYICLQPELIRKDSHYINRLKRFNSDELYFDDECLDNQQNAFDPLEMPVGVYPDRASDDCNNFWTDSMLSKQDAFKSLY